MESRGQLVFFVSNKIPLNFGYFRSLFTVPTQYYSQNQGEKQRKETFSEFRSVLQGYSTSPRPPDPPKNRKFDSEPVCTPGNPPHNPRTGSKY